MRRILRFKTLFFLVLLSLNSTFSLAKNPITPSKFSLEGKVVSKKTGKAIEGASVTLPEMKLASISKANGNFAFNSLQKGSYLLEISMVGYETSFQQINLVGNNNTIVALNESVVEQEGVTVTGVASAVRLKQSIQPINIVKRSQLMQTSNENLMSALASKVPGLNVLTTGPAIAKPVIRGLGYNRVVVINDGVRQEGQQWGDEHGIEIDEYSVQKVEILKGPASVMYGSDAMAGVINIISNQPVEQGTVKANLMGTANGNNNLQGYSGNIAGHLKNGFSWNVYGTYRKAADYKNKYDGYVLNSRFNEQNFGGYVGLNKSWGFSHFIFSKTNQNFGLIEGERDDATGNFIIDGGGVNERVAVDADYKNAQLQIPKQNIQHTKFAIDNSILIGKDRLELNLGYQRNERREYGNPDDANEIGLFFDLSTITYTAKYHLAQKNGWKTSFGVNGMQQQNKNRAEEVLIPAYKQTDIGGFVYTSKNFGKNTTVSGGVRMDNRQVATDEYFEGADIKFSALSKSFSNISGSIGVAHNIGDALIFKANIARAFRAPTVSELSSNGAHEGTNRYEYGTDNLKSETALQFDAGLEWNTQHISGRFNAFYNHINNYIFYNKLSSVAGGDSLVNVDGEDIMAFKFNQHNAALYGFEASIDIHPHPLDWLHIDNSFSYVRGTFDTKFEGSNNIPFIPAARLLTEVRADIKSFANFAKNGYLKLVVDNTGAQNNVFSPFDTETTTKGYTLLNVGFGADVVSKKQTLFSINVFLNNITDVAYQNHLSRLKYTGPNMVTGRNGVFNMGRNIGVKVNVPLQFTVKN